MKFQEGSRYRDFDPSIEKLAIYGLTGLIAGIILVKAGLLARSGIVSAAFWKIIVLAIDGLGAGIKRFFSAGKEDRPPA